MYRNGIPSWSVRTEARDELNFAIYIACTYDLLPRSCPFSETNRWSVTTESVSDQALIASQWNEWWNQLVKHRLESFQSPRWSALYNPPDFNNLDRELRQLCVSVWQGFHKWWNMPAGGKTAMIFWESADNVGQLVRQFELEAGRKARLFQMTVDLVYAGLDDVIEVSDEYAIMPLRSMQKNQEWWMKKLHQIG